MNHYVVVLKGGCVGLLIETTLMVPASDTQEAIQKARERIHGQIERPVLQGCYLVDTDEILVLRSEVVK